MVKAKVELKGTRGGYKADNVLVDTGVRMSIMDVSLAENIGVEYTGREIDFISISGHKLKAKEAIIKELRVEDVSLKYEAVAVAQIPREVKEVLKRNNLDENVIIGLITTERANLIPDIRTGRLEKGEAFIL